MHNSVDNKSRLLVITIQIDEKRTGKIDVCDNDDPEVLARDFCIKYNVNQRIVPLLIENINKNIAIAAKERMNMNQYLQQKQQSKEEQYPQIEQIEQQIEQQSAPSSQQMQYSPMKRSADSNTVYDRLYQDAHNKKLKRQLVVADSRTKKILKSQESEINYGLILYQKGLKKKEELLLKAESAKKDQQNSQFAECTYHPRINDISRQIAIRSPEPVGEHLNKLARQIQEKKENAINNKIDLEQQFCSFHPQINKISQYIVEEKKKQSQIQIPHYESLYQDNDTKKAKLQLLDQNYFTQYHSFHPKIDDISEKMVQGIGFEERQAKYRYHSKERNQSADESQLFKPKTGRPPESRPQDLFKSLYDQASIWAQNKVNKQSQSQEKMMSQSRIRASQKSDILMQQQMYKAITTVFEQLDSDQDGEIDALRIDLSKVDQIVLNLFKPLLLEMEEGKHVLNKEEFVESALRLVQTLSNNEKHEILKKPKKIANNEFTFQVQNNIYQQPTINQRSQRIVASRRV